MRRSTRHWCSTTIGNAHWHKLTWTCRCFYILWPGLASPDSNLSLICSVFQIPLSVCVMQVVQSSRAAFKQSLFPTHRQLLTVAEAECRLSDLKWCCRGNVSCFPNRTFLSFSRSLSPTPSPICDNSLLLLVVALTYSLTQFKPVANHWKISRAPRNYLAMQP